MYMQLPTLYIKYIKLPTIYRIKANNEFDLRYQLIEYPLT